MDRERVGIPRDEQAVEREPYNLAVLALHLALVRVGWIFKTESVIMPAFLDHIAGAGWMRGMLTVLNRLGLSVPPLTVGARMEAAPLKKRAMFFSTLGMAASFLLLSGLLGLLDGRTTSWLPMVFMGLYGLFFFCNGLNAMGLFTLQGKLIRADRRGRLLTLSAVGGSVPAVLAAWWLLSDWLRRPDGGYILIFGFTGFCFLIAAVVVLRIRESPDPPDARRPSVGTQLHDAYQAVRGDRRLVRLCATAMLFSMVVMLFPHYQALGRERLGLTDVNLMTWVVVQNVATGVGSLAVGPMADRFGNRLTMRVLLALGALAPAGAVAALWAPVETAETWYWLVFLVIGLTPLNQRTFHNYTLELSPHDGGVRYLGAVNLSMMLPLALSPGVGWLIDHIGFVWVMSGGGLLILLGSLLTFTLDEPRRTTHRPP